MLKQRFYPLAESAVMARAGGGSGNPMNDPKYVNKVFFVYEFDTTATLNAGASTNGSFNIAGDSDFFWTKFAAFAQVGSAATTYSAQQLPSLNLLLTNTTTGRNYMSSAVPLACIAGTAQFPFILPAVTLWDAKSTIQIQLQNEGNAAYTQIHLAFLGIKAFPG